MAWNDVNNVLFLSILDFKMASSPQSCFRRFLVAGCRADRDRSDKAGIVLLSGGMSGCRCGDGLAEFSASVSATQLMVSLADSCTLA